MKQIDKQLWFLSESRRVMRQYPDIKEEFTLVIFGFPNVGKTTLLNRLCQTTAKVASYSFTTKTVNSGSYKVEQKTVQVLDVPGTLARLEKMNDIERIAYLTVNVLADVVVYVFDITGMVSLKKQEELYKQLKSKLAKDKKLLIYLSKKDITCEKKIRDFSKKYKLHDFDGLKKEISKIV